MVIHADRFGGIVEKVIGCDRGAPQRKGSMFSVCLLQVIELICRSQFFYIYCHNVETS